MKAFVKTASMLVSCCLLASTVFPIYARAFSENDVDYIISSLEEMGFSDETISKILVNEIDLTSSKSASDCFYLSVMSNGATFSSASSTLFYNWSNASYYGYTSGEAATNLGISVTTTGPVYNTLLPYWSIQQTYTASSPVTPYGSLCNYKFKGSNAVGTIMTATSVTGINFEYIYPGDIDDNGVISASDLNMLMQYISAPNINPLSHSAKVAADCNGDGAVNNSDSVLLARIVADDPTATFW